MSLLTNCNEGTPGADYFINSVGGGSQIVGNPVQLCTNGPSASASGAVDSITAGGDPASSVLQIGNAGLANCMSFGPGQAATLTSQVLMIPNANLRVGQFTQIVINDNPAVAPPFGPGALTVNANGRVEMLAGSVMDFNNAGAPLSTFRSGPTALTNPIPNGATEVIPNPAGILEGVYSVMISTPAGDGFPQRQISTTAYWNGTTWEGGAEEQGNFFFAPNDARTQLTVINSVGGPVNAASVRFVLLAGGVAP